MTFFVCISCCEEKDQEAEGCTYNCPTSREAIPIYCTPDEHGRIRVPEWREVPEKKQAKII